MKSTNMLFILTISLIATGFLTLYIKDNSSDSDKELLKAIALLTNNLEHMSQQLNDNLTDTKVIHNNTITTTQQDTTGDEKLEISAYSPRLDFSNGTPNMITISPTPEQNTIYENLKARLDDPDYSEGLGLMALKTSPEMRQLDSTMQMLILNKAVEMFNNGEISKEVFLAGMETAR